MEDLLSLNTSNQKTANHEAVKKFDNLVIGDYLVKSFQLKDTKFGLRVFVEIDDFYLILPARFSDKINSKEQLEELNDQKWKMEYRGKNKDEFGKLMIDFKLLNDESAADDTSSDGDDGHPRRVRKPIKRKSDAATALKAGSSKKNKKHIS